MAPQRKQINIFSEVWFVGTLKLHFSQRFARATRMTLFGTRSLRPVVMGEASLIPLLVSRVRSRESVILVAGDLRER